jgi:hypothetical protein
MSESEGMARAYEIREMAEAVKLLVDSGFTYVSVREAVVANDFSLLRIPHESTGKERGR